MVCNAGEHGNKIKEGEKPGGDFSKAGAADRESNVEHKQTAASSNEQGNWRGLWGLATERKREKELKKGDWAGRWRLKMGRRILMLACLRGKNREKKLRRENTCDTKLG